MPELPEVQTTVDGLNKKIKGLKIIDVWTDVAVEKPSLNHYLKTTKSKHFFKKFKKMVIDTYVIKNERRAKNIFIHLSNKNTIWIHLKMTGHLMYGKYTYHKTQNMWSPAKEERNSFLRDPYNRFLHTVFSFQNGYQLVFSDVRKFGKITIFETKQYLSVLKQLNLGPEPLSKTFTHKILQKQLQKKSNRPIKEVLLNQSIISGLGNIYSDEALWYASIHPARTVSTLSKEEIKNLTLAIKKVLKISLKLGGDSMSDYRDIDGKKGTFQNQHIAYRQTGLPCSKKDCFGKIQKIILAGRSTHFCNVHQR